MSIFFLFLESLLFYWTLILPFGFPPAPCSLNLFCDLVVGGGHVCFPFFSFFDDLRVGVCGSDFFYVFIGRFFTPALERPVPERRSALFFRVPLFFLSNGFPFYLRRFAHLFRTDFSALSPLLLIRRVYSFKNLVSEMRLLRFPLFGESPDTFFSWSTVVVLFVSPPLSLPPSFDIFTGRGIVDSGACICSLSKDSFFPT